MKKLLLALVAIVFAYPVLADDSPGAPYGRMNGDIVPSTTATQTTYNWGYFSKKVEVCLEDDASQLYFRLGTVAATSSTVFIDGSTGILAGSAAVLHAGGDGTDVKCYNLPVRTNAMTFHQVTAGTATARVTVFGE